MSETQMPYIKIVFTSNLVDVPNIRVDFINTNKMHLLSAVKAIIALAKTNPFVEPIELLSAIQQGLLTPPASLINYN